MAWVTEYDMTWRSGDSTGSIYIQRDGGSYQQGLLLKRDTLEIRNFLPNWEEQIVRSNCSFTIVNDFSDFYTLLPLMTISNGQLKVIVTRDTSEEDIIFEGYINCEAVDQDMLNFSNLRLTASGLINKLEFDSPVDIETLQNMSLIDIIDACLVMTGSSYRIRVNCSLYEISSPITGRQTLFNRTGAFTELFWKNNIDRVSALDIIKMILKSFNSYLYWYAESWYIEHYEDLGQNEVAPYQKSYVTYTSGQGYGENDNGVDHVLTMGPPHEVHDPQNRPQVGDTQRLAVIPGMKIIEVRLNQKQYFNLINGDLTDITEGDDIYPLPGWREWVAYNDSGGSIAWWLSAGATWRNISNSIERVGYDVDSVNGYGNGITTSFKMTLNEDTMLTLKWKWGLPSTSYVPYGFSGEWGDYTIKNYYWISIIIGGTAYFIIHNDSAGTWTFNIGTVAASLNSTQISGTEVDSDLLTAEFTVSIPIGELFATSSGAEEDAFITFGIGHEQFDDGTNPPLPAAFAYFGDVLASMSETPDNNLIRGEVNTDFLNKLTVNLDLFDSGWSYRNVLVRGTNFSARAKLWGYDSEFDSLSRWVLSSKFRLYNIARQRITSDYILTVHHDNDRLIPLSLWNDDKQSDKLFIQFSDIYKPEKDRHTIELNEYDNTTTIDLV